MTALAAPLGETVLRRPQAATTFERLGLDYCCGGRRTLTEACSRQGLDAKTVAANAKHGTREKRLRLSLLPGDVAPMV